MDKTIKRGDIYYADLNPVVGSEQGGTRPVLVISNDIGNKHSPTVIIAAITSRVRKKKKLPTHLYLGQIEGLPANSIILFEQLRTIDKSRLKEHLTHLDEQYLKSLELSTEEHKRHYIAEVQPHSCVLPDENTLETIALVFENLACKLANEQSLVLIFNKQKQYLLSKMFI